MRLDALYAKPAEVIKSQLEEVGIYTPMKSMEQTLWSATRDANELKGSIDWLDDCNWPFLTQDYMPDSRILWAQQWHLWQTSGGARRRGTARLDEGTVCDRCRAIRREPQHGSGPGGSGQAFHLVQYERPDVASVARMSPIR